MKISYLKGNATKPQSGGSVYICHICNNVGAWGAGFVLAISKRWKEPEGSYKRWYSGDLHVPMDLGMIQVVKVEDRVSVVNMIAQNGLRSRDNPVPFSLYALELCLVKVRDRALGAGDVEVHMPRIGAGLGGGNWGEIEALIERVLCDHGVKVTVYDLPATSPRLSSCHRMSL